MRLGKCFSATEYVSLKFPRTPCAVYYVDLQMLINNVLTAKYTGQLLLIKKL